MYFDDYVQKKLKAAITAKLAETREHVEKELPEYIMSMIINKKTKVYMIKNLEAFMSEDTKDFCDWIFDLVEKINEAEPGKAQEIDTGDFGSAPANIIKEVERKERESRDKPASSFNEMERARHREDSSRKRKAEDEKPKARAPIEAPRREERESRNVTRRDASKRETEREKDRHRESHRNRETRRDKERRERSNSRKRRGDSDRVSRDHREEPREKTRPTAVVCDSSSDEGSLERLRVASKVVANRIVETTPSVCSKVTVKRNARQMGDVNLMKARSSMFIRAMKDASHSVADEPAPKTRIVERTISDINTDESCKEQIIRVRLDVKKPPTTRMQKQAKAQLEANEEAGNKRKHATIIYDLTDEEIDLEDNNNDEDAIDKIIRETREVHVNEDDEPPTKRVATKTNFVDNKPEDTDVSQLKKKIRCTFWPKCTRGENCLFIHPNAICAMFPKCQFGQKCHYVHPPCKFAEHCKNKKCVFTHGDAEVAKMLAHYFPSTSAPYTTKIEIPPITILPDIPVAAAPVVTNSGIPCRYAERCTNPRCHFDHPKLCRFGDQCINDKCAFFHSPTNRPKPAPMKSNNRFKWTASTTAPSTSAAASEVMAS